MDRSFVSESGKFPKTKKNFSRSGFLTCSSDGNSSDNSSINDICAKFRSQEHGYESKYSVKSNKSNYLMDKKPPQSPGDRQRVRGVLNTSNQFTKSSVKSSIPSPSSSRPFLTSKTESQPKLNGPLLLFSEVSSKDKKIIPKKSLSFQSFPSNPNLNPTESSKRKTNIPFSESFSSIKNPIFYSLERPMSNLNRDNLSDSDMDPRTLKPKNDFIRRSAKPSLDKQRRREYSLKFMIESIENVTSKKRYHCELKLNNRTYARTSSRVAEKSEAVWNEIYELCNLSPVTSVTINLYKEMVEGKGGKRKNIRQKIAFVTLPIEELYERNEVKKKLTMQKNINIPISQTNGTSFCLPSESRSNESYNKHKRNYRSEGSDSDIPRINGEYCSSSLPRDDCSGYSRSSFLRYLRSKKDADSMKICISAKYQCIEILPLVCYSQLREFILDHYECLVQYLDNKLSGRRLEEIASSLISIHELVNNAPQFITNSICNKLESTNDPQSIALRSNTIGSKAMESYMKLIGMDYLKSILGEFSMKVLFYPSSLEVDPIRLEDKSLLKLTQVQLCSMVQSLWNKIANSINIMPTELKRVFSSLRYNLEKKYTQEFADQLLSGCVFLRFICPAILNPYLYQLIQEYPQDPRIIRNFTLISKSLQTLANQTGSVNDGPSIKEPFMIPIHESLANERNRMINFLREISTEPFHQSYTNKNGNSKWHQFIDIGYELAVSHLYYLEIFIEPSIDKNLPLDLKPLIPILQDLQTYLTPAANQNSTTEMAELLSRNCKILADNAIGEFSSDIEKVTNFKKEDSAIKTPNQTQQYETYNGNRNTLRKKSAPSLVEHENYDKKDPNRVTTRHTINVDEINHLWKCLVEKSESHLANHEQAPQIDVDFDPDFKMEYQFCFDSTDDASGMDRDNFSLPSLMGTPISNNTTKSFYVNGDQSSKDSSPVINYPPPPSIDTLPQNSTGLYKISPTKSIRMGTKAVQTVQSKKPTNDIETMRRLVTEAEIKYLQAQKEIADKEEENRVLRELLRNQTNKSHKEDVR